MGWLWALPFVLLPLQPSGFVALMGLVGLWGAVRGYRPMAGLFGSVAVVGMVGQFFVPVNFYSMFSTPVYIERAASDDDTYNLIRPFDLYALHGWNHTDEGGGRAVPQDDGFWRVPRYNPLSRREQSEFLTYYFYPIKPGQTYTQSFYLRHDGQRANLQITFFTNQGHHPVPTQVEPVAPGVYRVWGSYTAKEGDHSLRAIDFLNYGGDYTYLDVGWAQLELGSAPTAYRPGRTGELSKVQRAWAWASQIMLGWLVLVGVGFVRRYLEARWLVRFVLLGLALHLGYAFWHFDQSPGRTSGLTPQPNLLGHTAVMTAGLVVLLGRWWAGLWALLGAGLGVAASGSRTAFLALLLLGFFWVWSFPRGRGWGLLSLGVLVLVFLRWPELLGRLGQLGLDASGQARLQFWQVAWEAFLQHPWLGVGWGHFPLFFQMNLPQNFIELPTHAHNLWLSLLAEGGLVLLAAFLGLILGVLYQLILRKAWPAVALWAIALGLNALDYTFFYSGVFGPLWVGVGWVLYHVQYQRERTDNTRRRDYLA